MSSAPPVDVVEQPPGVAVYPPPAPSQMQGPRGAAAYQFTLAYSAYNPAAADPGQQWLATWQSYAGQQLRSTFDSDALRLYQFALAQSVSVINPLVTGVRVLRDEGGQSLYEVDVARILLPLGATEQDPGTRQDVGWRLTVNDTAQGPRVTAAVFLPGGTAAAVGE